ncbi:MAG: hypothetical protein LH468_11835 [Nocardioides sp.]|nr:hypothetical protein [Nocardioides sp.]
MTQKGPQRERLEKYLLGASDQGIAEMSDGLRAYRAALLAASDQLTQAAEKVQANLKGHMAERAAPEFTTSSAGMTERGDVVLPANTSVIMAASKIVHAKAVHSSLADIPSDPDPVDPTVRYTPEGEKEAASRQAQASQNAAALADQEAKSKAAADGVDEEYQRAIEEMKKIHGIPDPPAPVAGASATEAGGAHTSTFAGDGGSGPVPTNGPPAGPPGGPPREPPNEPPHGTPNVPPSGVPQGPPSGPLGQPPSAGPVIGPPSGTPPTVNPTISNPFPGSTAVGHGATSSSGGGGVGLPGAGTAGLIAGGAGLGGMIAQGIGAKIAGGLSAGGAAKIGATAKSAGSAITGKSATSGRSGRAGTGASSGRAGSSGKAGAGAGAGRGTGGRGGAGGRGAAGGRGTGATAGTGSRSGAAGKAGAGKAGAGRAGAGRAGAGAGPGAGRGGTKKDRKKGDLWNEELEDGKQWLDDDAAGDAVIQ